MPRLLGINIPNNKKIEYALRYIYGIGPMRSRLILNQAGIDVNMRSDELSENHLNSIIKIINQNGYKIEGDLRREVFSNIKRLQLIKSYRGMRHIKKLPARGQRTQSNARTCKGKKKTISVVKRKK